MLKKIVSGFVIVCLLAVSLCSCKAKTDDRSGHLKIDGKDVLVDSVLKIDGVNVPFDLYRYCYLSTKDYLTQSDPDFKIDTDEGKKKLLDEALEQVKYFYSINKLAEKYGYELDEADIAEIESTMKSTFESAGTVSDYKSLLKENFLSHEAYKEILSSNALYEKMLENLIGTDDTSRVKMTEQEALDVYNQLYYHLMCIYFTIETTDAEGVPLSEEQIAQNTAEQQKKANDAYAELKDGASFDDVMKKYMGEEAYNNDLQNYYPVESISNGLGFDVSSLYVGDYTEVLNAQSTFYIIKRLKSDDEYLKKNMSSVISVCRERKLEDLIIDYESRLNVIKLDRYDDITPDSLV